MLAHLVEQATYNQIKQLIELRLRWMALHRPIGGTVYILDGELTGIASFLEKMERVVPAMSHIASILKQNGNRVGIFQTRDHVFTDAFQWLVDRTTVVHDRPSGDPTRARGDREALVAKLDMVLLMSAHLDPEEVLPYPTEPPMAAASLGLRGGGTDTGISARQMRRYDL